MKYFAPIECIAVERMWQLPLPPGYRGQIFIQCKKDGTPQKNASIYQPKEMATLKYDYKIIELKEDENS